MITPLRLEELEMISSVAVGANEALPIDTCFVDMSPRIVLAIFNLFDNVTLVASSEPKEVEILLYALVGAISILKDPSNPLPCT